MIRFARIGILVALPLLLANSATSAPSEPLHFPYDPACNWGRIADGRGMILRCVTQAEAAQLQAASAVPAKIVSPPGNATADAKPPPVTGSDVLASEVVEVQADEGDLPLARKKLAIPLERYAACVQKNGGLEGPSGLVAVKFLVRERGRAEGASVGTYQGVTEAAARCIADVVDRRPTGTPEAPVVSASVSIRIFRQPKP